MFGSACAPDYGNLDPSDPTDTDGDGISDYDEVNGDNTNPENPDTDGDGLKDGDEKHHETNPHIRDTDGDGFSDGEEVEARTDPLEGEDHP